MAEALSVNYSQQHSFTVQKEDVFPMRTKDWVRMRKRLASMNRSRRELSAAAWAAVGVLISAGFAALSWVQPFNGLAPEQQAEYAWVWTVIVAAGIVGAVLAAGLFWAAHIIADQQKVTVDSILDDMDEIHDVRGLLQAK